MNEQVLTWFVMVLFAAMLVSGVLAGCDMAGLL
jgi:outer membrane murein-binding lipoprotein Lpp